MLEDPRLQGLSGTVGLQLVPIRMSTIYIRSLPKAIELQQVFSISIMYNVRTCEGS